MKLVQDLEIKPGARVLLRCDLNLPQDDEGKFTDFFRLESSLPTIEYLQEREATIFITSHLGSPKGKLDPKLSLEPLAQVLTNQLRQNVEFIADPFNSDGNLPTATGIFLVENLRFWPGEEANSLEFSRDLIESTGAEVFVQDAFGVSHRGHASLTSFPKLLPSTAGLLLQKEIASLTRPDEDWLVLMVGGAKVESKLPVISNFLDRADSVLTGGVVANTFLKVSGKNISDSLFEEACAELAQGVSEKVGNTKTQLLLPRDYICAKSPEDLLAHEFDDTNLQPGQMILDLGPRTIDSYERELNKAKTVIWAGTLGFAEKPTFAEASKEVLQKLLDVKSQRELKVIIGGGDTVDFVRDRLDPEELNQIDHLSTGGGASLLMLSGQELPGIRALEDSPSETPTSESKSAPKPEVSALASGAPVLVANLKSHFNLEESKEWLSKILSSETLTSPGVSFGVAPSDISLEEFSSLVKSANLKNPPELFAQNISSESEGSNTGEVSASQLKGVASGTIIGHSERRSKHSEDNQVVSEKILRAVDSGLEVILCVGGKSEDSTGQRREVYEQLKSALTNLNSQQSSLVTVAYEPVFAIGTGKIPTEEFLKEQLNSIKELLEDSKLDSEVLYGGSVSADNAKDILGIGFDGLLVGSASLSPKSLEEIGINISA